MVRNILNSFVVHIILALFIYINAKDIYYYETVNPIPVNTISIKIIKEQNKALGKEFSQENYFSKDYSENKKLIAEAKQQVQQTKKAKIEAQKNIKPKQKPKVVAAPEKVAADATEKTKTKQSIKKEDKVTRAKVIKGEAETEVAALDKKESVSLEEFESAIANQEAQDEQLENILDYIDEETHEEYLDSEIERQITESQVYRPEKGTDGYTGGANLVGKNIMKLSLSERRGVQDNIQHCYRQAIMQNNKDSDKVVTLIVRVNREGYMDLNSVQVLGREKYIANEEIKSFDVAVNNAKLALKYCNPLRNLPQTKYRIWREMSLEFDSSEL